MKISTKGIYAIEALLDLATYSQNGVESLKNIAERRKLSDKYLEQIISALRRAGLVSSIRGAGGGYRLAKSAEEITVKLILEAVENSLIPIECLTAGSECSQHVGQCAPRNLWGKIWNEIESVISNVTLQQLMEESNKYAGEKSIEYYI